MSFIRILGSALLISVAASMTACTTTSGSNWHCSKNGFCSDKTHERTKVGVPD